MKGTIRVVDDKGNVLTETPFDDGKDNCPSCGCCPRCRRCDCPRSHHYYAPQYPLPWWQYPAQTGDYWQPSWTSTTTTGCITPHTR